MCLQTKSVHTVTVIGSGNVATHLSWALLAAGYKISQVLSRNKGHALRLASQVGAQPLDRVSELDPHSDVYLLAVNDDALYDLAAQLRLPEGLVVHTSGSTPASVLAPISPTYGVVWSPQTFVRDIPMQYSHLPLCIEGNSSYTVEAIEALFSPVSDNLHRLNWEQRRWAHLAAVVVNNFGNAINALAQEITTQHGIDFSILRPLMEGTLHKADHGSLWPQQTGPARRHDQKTLDAQRALLANDEQLLQLYDLMTEIIQSRGK